MDRDRVHMVDILEAARLAVSYVGDEEFASFSKDVRCQDAVIRRLEIIGEAARRTSDKAKRSFPDLPWHEMIGMRNFMIHEYDNVDINTVFSTVRKDLPPLIGILEEILD